MTWAERHRVLAAELHSGNNAAKPSAPRLVDEALAWLPQGHGPVRSAVTATSRVTS